MIFSARYRQALESNKIDVEIPDDVRKKLSAWTWRFDHHVLIYPNPHDNLNYDSSVVAEAVGELLTEYGWEIDEVGGPDSSSHQRLEFIMTKSHHYRALDAIETVHAGLEPNQKEPYRQKINEIFQTHRCPWRLQDGQFFKLDSAFLGAELIGSAYGALVSNNLVGAADEFAKARQEQVSGEVKDAIFHACKSFESTLKVLTGESHLNADKLLQKFQEQGYLDDLPEAVRAGVTKQVLTALPFLRNKLSGHGQGAEVVTVPSIYGELAIQLAAAFQNFLIAKHVERGAED